MAKADATTAIVVERHADGASPCSHQHATAGHDEFIARIAEFDHAAVSERVICACGLDVASTPDSMTRGAP
ncbi:hypothetical protein [Lysobacter claricitrinus]|uniref:hypothetical protein n=1 Tax=Lysobacter claricitrinus TaxID=3367728 RepID=UPI0038B3BF10